MLHGLAELGDVLQKGEVEGVGLKRFPEQVPRPRYAEPEPAVAASYRRLERRLCLIGGE